MDIKGMTEKLLRLLDAEEKEQGMRYQEDEGLRLKGIQIQRKTIGYLDYPELSFRIPFPAETTVFRDGTAIELRYQTEEPVKGMLLEFDGRQGTFRLYAPDFPDWIEERGLQLVPAPDTRTTGILKDAIRAIHEDRRLSGLFRAIHGAPLPAEGSTHPGSLALKYRNNRLDPSQRAAVAMMLDNKDLCIIHGPPGTGKTTTLTEGILQLIEQGHRIIATAPGNAAVDHLCRSLIAAGAKVLRVGNTGKVAPDIFPYTPEGRLSEGGMEKQIKDLRIRAEEFRRMAMKYKRNFGKEEREQRNLLMKEVKSIRTEIRALQAYHEEKLFKEAQVIAGTPVGLQDAGVSKLDGDTLVMDEAGQCMEPFAWLVFPMARRIVLAGDHWQLPPTVLSQAAAREGLSISILERAVNSHYPLTLLSVQYRMRRSIAGFSSERFYEGKIETPAHLADLGIHVTFIDTAGSGTVEQPGENGGSLRNEAELDIAARLLRTEISDPASAAFISPYAAQVASARDVLPEATRISTIDSFQGQEMPVVIVSLVRSNDEGVIGFLKDYRRMNVALTRAQESLFVIGDSATIGADPFYRAFLEYAERQGSYRSVWEFMDY
jgi:ATP-dependent RNA/DNA helicase IGHMBP2